MNREVIVVRIGDVEVGEIIQADDGEYVFFPNDSDGFWRMWMLQVVVDRLSELNNRSNEWVTV